MRIRMRTFAHAALASLLLLAAPAVAQNVGAPAPVPSDEEVGRYVMEATVSIFLHELGHAVINLLELPVVGAEEDVADEFATLVLIAVGREDPVGHRAALASARTFLDMWESMKKQLGGDLNKYPYWDEHGIDIKRAFNVVCLLYGSEPETFEPALKAMGANDDRAQRCARDFDRKVKAWDTMLEPHIWPEGEAPPEASPRFIVEYPPVETEIGQAMDAIIRPAQIYDRLAADLSVLFKLPQDVFIRVRECGEPNAFWMQTEGGEVSINMCYELMKFLGDLYVESETGAQPGAGQPAPTTGQPTVAQPVPIQPMPAPVQPAPVNVSIVGVWQGQTMDMVGLPAQTQLDFRADGQFVQTQQNEAGAKLTAWGQYELRGNVLVLFTAGWQERQYCSYVGCMPVALPQSAQFYIQFRDANTFQSQSGIFYRIQ